MSGQTGNESSDESINFARVGKTREVQVLLRALRRVGDALRDLARLSSLPVVAPAISRELQNFRLPELTHRFVSTTFSAVWRRPFSTGRAIISP
jgi:hypothetical protein